MSSFRRSIFVNKRRPEPIKTNIGPEAFEFHKTLPNYQATPLISLSDLANELGVKKVLIKDESSRFGLPSFKILGASWGSCRAIMQRLGLPETSKLDDLKQAIINNPLTLIAATDGNHGRAVAHIASLLGISATILVPADLDQHVKDAISDESAKVIDIEGGYDTAVQHAAQIADEANLLVQDTAWEGYEEIPAWIVQGYSTIFKEIAEQDPTWSENSIVITPVGVGSLAHGVVQSCKPQVKVVSVEPDTAACLYESRVADKLTPIKTSFTIMTGMDCGTVSYTAFGDLRNHVDISLTISDFESHQAVQYLEEIGIPAGPCGASGVAAARRLALEGVLDKDTTLILLNTESSRKYKTPHDVSTDNPVELTQILTRIESTNVTLSKTPGSGEKEIANYIQAWFEHRNIETHQVGTSQPSVVAVVKGSGGRSLIINGHIDTVSLDGHTTDPLGGNRETRNGREVVTGRGALDMKAGVAIGMCNLAKAKKRGSKGDVIFCGVADEEDASIGTEAILAAGWKADAAIIPEPTQMELFVAHKGFVWI